MGRQADKLFNRQYEDGEYYDKLYDLCCDVNKANMSSFDGAEPNIIANTLRKQYNTFLKLCMIEENQAPVEKVIEKTVVVEKIVEKPVYRNIKRKYKGKVKHINTINMDINGWGRCPVCGCKIIKLQPDTFILNFPLYCKSCKRETLVSWCDTSVVQK